MGGGGAGSRPGERMKEEEKKTGRKNQGHSKMLDNIGCRQRICCWVLGRTFTHTHTHTRLHTRINSNKSVGRKVFFWGDFFPPPGHLQTNGSADSYRFSSPPFHLIRPLLAEEWTLNQVHPHFLFVVDEWTSRDLHVSSSPDFMESIQTLPHLLMQTNKSSFFLPSDFGTNKCGEVSTLALQQPSNSTSLSGSWPWQMIGKTLTRWSVEMWETICPPSSNSAQLQPPPNNKKKTKNRKIWTFKKERELLPTKCEIFHMLIGQFQGNVNLHLTFEQKKKKVSKIITWPTISEGATFWMRKCWWRRLDSNVFLLSLLLVLFFEPRQRK